MRTVPFFDYTHNFMSHKDQILEVVADVGSRGAFIMQKDLLEFEIGLAEYLGAKHTIGVGNATDAMEMSLALHGIGPGDEVLVSTHTMVATASAIATVGATVVPVDIGPDNLMDPKSCEASITSQTKAIMITQLNGRTANMDSINEIVISNDLKLFEDSAQALGSKYRNQAAGTFGLAGCLSFYPAKILGCFGDGGAIICNDTDIYEQYLMMRDHGRGSDGDVHLWGRNSRLDNLQAAILHLFLKSFDQVVARRREIAEMYQEKLGSCEGLQLPPAPNDDESHFDSFQNYEMQAEHRNELREFLASCNIGTLIQWGGKALHQFKKLGLDRTLPAADRFFERCLMLPMSMSLTDEDVSYVCDSVQAFYGQRNLPNDG